jgi:phage/plasmid-associated DNA primase
MVANIHDFDIHDYIERLTPSRKKGKFYCPVCNDPNFSIDKKGPGYSCYKGGCDSKEIREAIRPAAEVKQLLEADRERKRKTPIPYNLFAAHLKEMAGSGIPEGLARMNIRSVEDAHQIAEFLSWKGYMGSIGWLYTGVDPETGLDTGIGQFKPDEKFTFPNGNQAKYLSQKHAYDATCFRVPCWVMRKVSNRYGVPMPDGMVIVSDSDDVTAIFWSWVIDNPQLPISPAEGGKKALLLLAEGRIGISISGVDMATIGRGVDLVPSLKKLAVKGRPVEPFYDADIIEKPDVENALMAFGAALTRAGCVITVPTWDLELGKGVDDLAVNEGEGWENSLTVLSYKDWLKKLEQQRQELKKRSPVKKTKKQSQSQKRGIPVPANLKILQIEPTQDSAGQQLDTILQILGDTPVNEPVSPLLLATESDVEFARQHSIGCVILPKDEEAIERTIGQLQNAGCRALSYFADGNNETEQLLLATCERLQVACAVINSEVLYPDTEKGDIRQILTTMSTSDFIRRIEEELHSKAEQDKEHRQSLAKGDEDNEDKASSKPPSPQKTATLIAEQYRHQWKFDNEQKVWRIWTGKCWEKIEIGNFETLLMTVIEAKNIYYGRDSYLTDVLRLLTKKLRVARWQTWDRKRFINFNNYVLDVDKSASLEHLPGMGFTSHLPYEYKPLTGGTSDVLETLKLNCPKVYRWMNTAMQGDRQKILKLLAVINGLLKFRFFDLQMFVHLIGKPGSGKGTFIRLLQKIVGRENWKGCKLKNMDDGSTIASIIDKQLVACPDERTASGVDAILSLTGGDAVSYREVYKQASDAFFYGLLIVGSNNPIFVGDTTGLDRRLCLVHFDNPLPTARRNSNVEAEMDGEISQLIAVALSLSDTEVKERIQGEGKNQIAEFKFQEWDMKLQTNSVAAHFDDCLIVDPTASTPTGKVYEHYKEWCGTTLKAVSHIKYPKMLSELCNDHLGHTEVKWHRSGGRSWFEGLRLRSDGETSPTHSDSLSALIPQNSPPPDTGFDGVSTGLVRGSKPLPDGNYSHLRGKDTQNISNNLSNSASHEKNHEINQQTESTEIEKVGLNPVNPVKIPEPLPVEDLNPVANPVVTPQQPRQTPSSEIVAEQVSIAPMESKPTEPPSVPMVNWNVGERVKVSAQYPTQEYIDERATVVKVWSDGLCRIELDREISVKGGKPRKQFNLNGRYLVSESAADSNLNEEELELVNLMRFAIKHSDPLVTDAVKKCLAETCDKGFANRKKVWFALTTSERTAFKALLAELEAQPQPEQP